VFHRRRWFQGRPLRGTADIVWLKPDGTEMTEADWNEHRETCVGVFLGGDAIPSPGPRGERVVDDSYLLLINASAEPMRWTISGPWGESWHTVLDTTTGEPPATNGDGDAVSGDRVVTERSVVLLRRVDPPT
jgi:isoamylase